MDKLAKLKLKLMRQKIGFCQPCTSYEINQIFQVNN